MKNKLVILVNCARDHYDVCIEIKKKYKDIYIMILWSDEYTKNLIYNQYKSSNICHDYEEIYSDNLVEECKKKYNIEAVIPSGDDSVDLALKLQLKLTPNTSNSLETINLIKDKHVYLNYLKEKKSISTNQYNIDDIKTYPVVIKPKISFGGSENVWVVDNNNDIPININKNNFLAQEYVKGQEYAIDIASYNGEHHLLLSTKYFKNGNAIWQYQESIVDYINERYLIDEIFDYVCNCLDAIDWKFGITFTQVIVSDKIDLVEINFRKQGHIHDTGVKLSTGVRLSEHVVNLYLNPTVYKNRWQMYNYFQPYDRFWINIEKEKYLDTVDWNPIENLKSFVKRTDHLSLFNLPNTVKKTTNMLSSLGVVSLSHSNIDVYNNDVTYYKSWCKNIINE
jgi:predicted ATP-grasp superfamily ATP-dependent carboligase